MVDEGILVLNEFVLWWIFLRIDCRTDDDKGRLLIAWGKSSYKYCDGTREISEGGRIHVIGARKSPICGSTGSAESPVPRRTPYQK